MNFIIDILQFGASKLAVGKPLPRKDGIIKIKGEAKYIYDHSFPDEYFLFVIRSPYSHALIRNISIDKEKIVQLEVMVGTVKDIPGKNVLHVIHDDWPLLADKEVYHIGQPVAIVVGKTLKIAKLAAESVKIEYEELPSVYNPIEAKDHPTINIFEDIGYGKNVCSYWQQRSGNIEEGFSSADIIIENEYITPAQEHAYIEPQGVIAVPEGDEITIYGSMQCPYYVQRCVVDVLNYPWSKVTIVQTTTGGAFGGKEDQPNQIAALAALGAYLTKKPIKFIFSREEDIETTSKRHPSIIRFKTGATKEGFLTAVKVEYYLNTGAFATLGPAVLYRGALHAVGPYRCPNVDVQAYGITTNLVPFGAFRGFGSPQVVFACEEQMDRIASELKMDPLEFRRKNLLVEGDITTFGQFIDHSVGGMETLYQTKELSNWKDKWKPAPYIKDVLLESETGKYLWKGIGSSTTFYGVGLGAAGKHMSKTGAYIQLEPDGSVIFAVGTTEMGQGMITVLSQIIADELGVDFNKIRMTPVDTSRVPDSGPTVASRSTTFSGRALQTACKKLLALMFEIIAPHLNSKPDELYLKSNRVYSNSSNINMQIEDAVKVMYQERGQVAVTGWDIAPSTNYDNQKGQGNAYVTYAWATNIVEVEVDVETGNVDILNIWSAHDVGKAINPQTVEGQIEGGVLQGLGYGRYEEIIFTSKGRIVSNNLSTYLIPTTKEAPNIFPIIVEFPWKGGPMGAKGFTEQPLMGIAPALTNAINNAIGIRLNEIPTTPQRVWKAIQKAKKED